MREAEAFEGAAFLGLARMAKRDPYRLSLFGDHLDPDEQPLALLPVQGGTLLVTDRRLLEFQAHLEIHGAWNVKEFQGYAVRRSIRREAIRAIDHAVSATEATGRRGFEDRLLLTTRDGPQELLVSRGPAPTLSDEDFGVLRDAVLGRQPK